MAIPSLPVRTGYYRDAYVNYQLDNSKENIDNKSMLGSSLAFVSESLQGVHYGDVSFSQTKAVAYVENCNKNLKVKEKLNMDKIRKKELQISDYKQKCYFWNKLCSLITQILIWTLFTFSLSGLTSLISEVSAMTSPILKAVELTSSAFCLGQPQKIVTSHWRQSIKEGPLGLRNQNDRDIEILC